MLKVRALNFKVFETNMDTLMIGLIWRQIREELWSKQESHEV